VLSMRLAKNPSGAGGLVTSRAETLSHPVRTMTANMLSADSKVGFAHGPPGNLGLVTVAAQPQIDPGLPLFSGLLFGDSQETEPLQFIKARLAHGPPRDNRVRAPQA